eukprot:9385781-Alexandrium_andersonii.AAC.1
MRFARSPVQSFSALRALTCCSRLAVACIVQALALRCACSRAGALALRADAPPGPSDSQVVATPSPSCSPPS